MNKKIIFEEKKQEIMDAITSKSQYLDITEPVTLIDGFLNQPIQKELPGPVVREVPVVRVVGNNSGRVYYFALKVLLPDLKI